MKNCIFIWGLCLITAAAFAQKAGYEYYNYIRQADSLYKSHDYYHSGRLYSVAFQSFGGLGYVTDRFNAACAWSMAGYTDSAFYQLQRIVDKTDFADYDRMIEEEHLKNLTHDPRWKTLIAQIKNRKDEKEKAYDRALLQLLDSMVIEDQKWRNILRENINSVMRGDTITREEAYTNCTYTDSMNYIILQKIFKEYGFPNHDLVGMKGSNYFWLLVQHQDKHPSFQENVLREMKIAVDANKASVNDYAYLVDRVQINTGQLQIYGTQLEWNTDKKSYVPKAVMDLEQLNTRRKSVGMESIESYIEFMNNLYSGTWKE